MKEHKIQILCPSRHSYPRHPDTDTTTRRNALQRGKFSNFMLLHRWSNAPNSRKIKKSHQSSATADQPIAGPSASVDRSVNAKSRIHVSRRTPDDAAKMAPPTSSVEAPMDAPPELKTTRAIRSHARSKKRDPSKVNCAFVNANCENYRD